jgi:hypothetical protein
LQFDGNTTDGTFLNSFHQMGDESKRFIIKIIIMIKLIPCNAITHSLAWNNSNIFANSFVCVEIMGKTCVVFLDYYTGSFLYRLCTNSTHFSLLTKFILLKIKILY